MKPYEPTNPDRPVAVGYEGPDVVVLLANGEVLRTPISLHPWLERATSEQRANMEFDGHSVYWPDMDDGLDIEWMRRAAGEGEQDLAERVRALEQDPQRRTLLVEFLDLLTRAERTG